MKITVIGLGYVGLTNAAYLSQFHHITGFDIDFNKINYLKSNEDYLNEPGLLQLIKRNQGKLNYVEDPSAALKQSEVSIISVPTPEGPEGQNDLSAIEDAIQQVIKHGKKDQMVIIRSTILPGTTKKLMAIAKQHHRQDLVIIPIPEFLSLGRALQDMSHPYRVVVGTQSAKYANLIKKVFCYPPSVPFLFTDPQTAELIKYASNGFLATKLSFINEMSQIAESVGADIQDVVKGMSYDPRIGELFLQPGIGFGGSCFPKDLKALQHLAIQHQIQDHMLEATLLTNIQQTTRFVQRFLARFQGNIKHKKIAILGLSYKGSTSDVSNSPAFKVIDMLTNQEAMLVAYDKKATFDFFNLRGEKPCLAYANDLEDALKDADAALILNDASELKALKPTTLIRLMKTPILFDGRNLFNPSKMKGIEYHSIGRFTR